MREYQDIETKSMKVTEGIVSSYSVGSRVDINNGITGSELLRRLQPRIKGTFIANT